MNKPFVVANLGRVLQVLMLTSAFAILLSGCQPTVATQQFTVPVVQVFSGQDFAVAGVEVHADITEQVRLIGVAAPDRSLSPWGKTAQQALEQLIRGQTITLETDAEVRDRQGRRLAYAWHNGVLLNEELVAGGYTLASSTPPNTKYDQRLAHAQDKARILGLGIWNPQRPLRQAPAGG